MKKSTLTSALKFALAVKW